MAGAVQGSLSQTALMMVHSASVSSVSGFDMGASILYSCRGVKGNLYKCKAVGASEYCPGQRPSPAAAWRPTVPLYLLSRLATRTLLRPRTGAVQNGEPRRDAS